MNRIVFLIVIFACMTMEAYAWRRGRRARSYNYYSTSSYTGFKTEIDDEPRYFDNTLSLQDIAMMRAQWMAHYCVMTHGIHGYNKKCPRHPSGVLEGIGCGGPKCGTCTYGSRTCVADAEVVGKNGMTYRVRFFR